MLFVFSFQRLLFSSLLFLTPPLTTNFPLYPPSPEHLPMFPFQAPFSSERGFQAIALSFPNSKVHLRCPLFVHFLLYQLYFSRINFLNLLIYIPCSRDPPLHLVVCRFFFLLEPFEDLVHSPILRLDTAVSSLFSFV